MNQIIEISKVSQISLDYIVKQDYPLSISSYGMSRVQYEAVKVWWNIIKMAKDELKLKIYSKIQELNIAIDKDLFDYGYEILNQYILLLLFSIIISILLEIQKELILFYIFFVPLRKNMGGFHFENKKVCLIFSIIISIFSSKIIRAEIFVSEKWSLVFLLMLVNIFLLGCQSHPNKQLTKFENKNISKKDCF